MSLSQYTNTSVYNPFVKDWLGSEDDKIHKSIIAGLLFALQSAEFSA